MSPEWRKRRCNWKRSKKMREGNSSGSNAYGYRRSNNKGKSVGLWYSERSRRFKSLSEEEQRQRRERKKVYFINKRENLARKPLDSILLSDTKKKKITKLLNETSSMYPVSAFGKSSSYEYLEDTDFKHEFLQHINGSIIKKLQSTTHTSLIHKNEILDDMFLKELEDKMSSPSYRKMQETRKRLPSMSMKDAILELIDKHQVVVLSGETGCGKTTQVAQFILDDYIKKSRGSECHIICTQPRRISAIAVAERVAQERDERLGISSGFQIRMEKTLPRSRGSILYCTSGVLLKFMESNPSLSRASHLILDEIHERDVVSDFLITVLKDVITYRKDVKVILMSATLNAEAFSKYYSDAPHINIPGFTYPVTEYYLEDVLQKTKFKFLKKRYCRFRNPKDITDHIEPYVRQLQAEKLYNGDVLQALLRPESEMVNCFLIFNLLKYVCKQDGDGSVLIFVTGFMQIQDICDKIKNCVEFPESKYVVIPLHSKLSTVDQKKIFLRSPKGTRKIIVSTQIAETSITIEDVTTVIDCGFIKYTNLDPETGIEILKEEWINLIHAITIEDVTTVIDCGFIKYTNLDPETGIEILKEEWVSCANASQRRGRAGRVKPGVCYHLFSKARYNLLDKFIKPEVLRKSLDDVILSLKMLQLGDAEPFLARLMDPPQSNSVKASLCVLRRLGALDEEELLTPLGYHMAKLPVGAQCSKMLLMGALFSCLDPILSVVASLGFKDAFRLSVTDFEEVDKKRFELSRGTNSDHLLLHLAIRGFEEASNPQAFCREYYLSSFILRTLQDIRKQFAQLLFDMKFIKNADPRSEANNCNSDNLSLVKGVIASGLYPNVAFANPKRRTIRMRSSTDGIMHLHPKSVLNRGTAPSPLLVYYIRVKSQKTYVWDGTYVFPLPIVFFGDQFRRIRCERGDDSFVGISINSTMRFLCTESTSYIVEQLRDRLAQIFESRVSNLVWVDWSQDSPEVKVLRTIKEIITCEDMEDLDLSDYDDC